MLSRHDQVTAGDELRALGEVVHEAPGILEVGSNYPECLLEFSKKQSGDLIVLREYYLKKVHKAVSFDSSSGWFTDKMPLNVIHLGLISLIFPDSPIIHVRRNPMDVCLSAFFTDFKTGNEYSFDINDTAAYYTEIFRLIAHYKSELNMRYTEIAYEDLVSDPENQLRRILELIDLPWQENCLNFSESGRVARTASYEQVTKPVYTSSVNRYLNYQKYLAEPLAALRPIMEQYGYLGQ